MESASLRFSSGIDVTSLGERVRSLRQQLGLSLDALSARSSVSRSMLSDIERGRKVPSVLVLDHVATALGTSIARLIDEERRARVIVRRASEQDVAVDPSGWERRILSPVLAGVDFEFMRTTLGPRVDAGTFRPHAPGSREYVAVEDGTLRLVLAGTAYLLNAGDSIYYAADCEHAFANPADEPCSYYLVMDVSTGPARSAARHGRHHT